MTDEQKMAFEEARKALDFPSHTSGSFVPRTLISTRSLFELEALAHIGAAVKPFLDLSALPQPGPKP